MAIAIAVAISIYSSGVGVKQGSGRPGHKEGRSFPENRYQGIVLTEISFAVFRTATIYLMVMLRKFLR